MKKFFLFLFTILFSLTLLTPPVFAKEKDTHVVLGADQVINGDYFAAGDTVTILGTIKGDAYVAGGTITIDGTVTGDIIAAGGSLTIRGTAQNVRVAGGQISINGTIAKNLTVFGGDVTVGDQANLQGSIVAGVGTITLLAPIGKGATIGGGDVVVSDVVNGNVYAGVGQLTLQPQAKVKGDLTYVSENKAQLLQGATVSGKLTHTLPPSQKHDTQEAKKAVFLGLGAATLIFKVIGMISAIVIGLMLIAVAPHFVKRVAAGIVEKPWPSLGTGVVTLILAPIIFVVLLLTVVGIPLAFIFLALYLITMCVSKLFVIVLLGQKIGGSLNPKMHLAWMFLIGLVIYELVTLIPVVGWIAEVVAVTFGIGSLLIQKKLLYSRLRKEQIV